MKDLIKLFQIMKEIFLILLSQNKRGIKELLHETIGADMTQWNNERNFT